MFIIAHIDMDAFFAAVEERDKPWLRGLPVVVGADPSGGKGRGVVSTANYAARVYGIRSALPIRTAWECSERARREGKPSTAFISPNFGLYKGISKKIMRIAREYTHALEQTSIDEAYLDFSHLRSFKHAKEAARSMKSEIRRKTGLTSSVGIGHNRMIAKIASDLRKPDALLVVKPSQVDSFLSPLSVRVLPGVGRKTEELLKRQNIKTVQDLRKYSWEVLENTYGSQGFDLYQKARGIATELITPEGGGAQKSIGEHETFMEDISDFRFAIERISQMAVDITKRLKDKGFVGFRTIVVTVRFSDFETKNRSITVKEPLYTEHHLIQKSLKLIIPFFEKKENPNGKAVRMLGLRIEKLL